MGTNYYLKSKTPRVIEVHDEVHIAKKSCGWRPLFQASDRTEHTPAVNSVADIKQLCESGEWEIENEYEEKISWQEFENLVLSQKEQGHTHLNGGIRATLDNQGYEFTREEFS
jgi:hypothetical protein